MITIKPIEEADLPQLSLLYEELTNKPTLIENLTKSYRSIKDNNQYIVLGAFKDDALVGSLMGIICQDLVGECRPFMVIENVIVSGQSRRSGIGMYLITEIEKIAKERNCYYVIFVSGGQRKEAHAFYESMGYKDEEVEGYRKHFY